MRRFQIAQKMGFLARNKDRRGVFAGGLEIGQEHFIVKLLFIGGRDIARGNRARVDGEIRV